MLENKDHCDYDTCVALKELGYSEPTLAVIDKDCMPEDGVNVFDLLSNSNKYKDSKNIDAPTLYEAQKWLREEKNIIVYPEKNSIGWFYTTHYNIGNVHRFKYSEEYYDSYEETLSEGVKCAVKILKENETIHE